jgi:hypothetical protein
MDATPRQVEPPQPETARTPSLLPLAAAAAAAPHASQDDRSRARIHDRDIDASADAQAGPDEPASGENKHADAVSVPIPSAADVLQLCLVCFRCCRDVSVRVLRPAACSCMHNRSSTDSRTYPRHRPRRYTRDLPTRSPTHPDLKPPSQRQHRQQQHLQQQHQQQLLP